MFKYVLRELDDTVLIIPINPSILCCTHVTFCCAAMLPVAFSAQPMSFHARHTGSYWGRHGIISIHLDGSANN